MSFSIGLTIQDQDMEKEVLAVGLETVWHCFLNLCATQVSAYWPTLHSLDTMRLQSGLGLGYALVSARMLSHDQRQTLFMLSHHQ